MVKPGEIYKFNPKLGTVFNHVHLIQVIEIIDGVVFVVFYEYINTSNTKRQYEFSVNTFTEFFIKASKMEVILYA